MELYLIDERGQRLGEGSIPLEDVVENVRVNGVVLHGFCGAESYSVTVEWSARDGIVCRVIPPQELRGRRD